MKKLELINIDGKLDFYKIVLLFCIQSVLYVGFLFSLEPGPVIKSLLILCTIATFCIAFFLLFLNSRQCKGLILEDQLLLVHWKQSRLNISIEDIELTRVHKRHTLVLNLRNGAELRIPFSAIGSLSHHRTGVWQLKSNDTEHIIWHEYSNATEQLIQLKNIIDNKILSNRRVDTIDDLIKREA
jgi:hypothetical protein